MRPAAGLPARPAMTHRNPSDPFSIIAKLR